METSWTGIALLEEVKAGTADAAAARAKSNAKFCKNYKKTVSDYKNFC